MNKQWDNQSEPLSSGKLIIAVIQFKAQHGSIERNRSVLLKLCEEAVLRQAQIIVLPEMCLTGYLWPDTQHLLPYVEEATGHTFQIFAKFCQKNQCYLAYGFAEIDSKTSKLYNSQNLINAQGELLGTYRKVHLFDADLWWATAGDFGFMNFKTEFGNLGLGICMDLNFDDFVDFHIRKNTDYLLFATNWLFSTNSVQEYWLRRLRIFPGVACIANCYGYEEWSDLQVPFSGHSCFIQQNKISRMAPFIGDTLLTTIYTRPLS